LENNATDRKDTSVKVGLDSTGSKYCPIAGFYKHGKKFGFRKSGTFSDQLSD